MNLDWRRLKAVVFESDDWGLCAWSPDAQAFRVLSDTPAFRAPAGRRYAGSTLESAGDVDALAATLRDVRGGDGFAPVWQANTIVAAPDYARMTPPAFDVPEMPIVMMPETPARWQRPGLWKAVARARDEGLWWPELHGLHHLPETAWLTALRRGEDDARRAHEHESPVCLAVEASGEYDPTEPPELRTRSLTRALEGFQALFGRTPGSFCPPDYRWDERLEADAERLGITLLQGKAEQMGPRFPRLRRLALRFRWPHVSGARFYMPPRIAFEPCGARVAGAAAAETAHRAAREAWSHGRPAVVSTHRANYAHLDPEHAAAGRAALRDLLQRLATDGATFLVDDEVRQLQMRGWSVRGIGARGAIIRHFGVPRDPIRFAAPAGTTGAALREGPTSDDAEVSVTGGEAVARLNVGAYLVEWT